MIDVDDEAAVDAPWTALRAIEPRAGAKQRVHDAVIARVEPRRRATWLVVPAAALAAAALWWMVRADQGIAVAEPVVVAASAARQGAHAITAGDRLHDGAVHVDAAGSLQVALDRARVDVVGPAELAVEQRRVVLRAGQVRVDGNTDVDGPTCRATIHGTSTVAVEPAHMVVTVVAGSAEITPPDVRCELIDLGTRPPTRTATANEPVTATATATATATVPAAATDPGPDPATAAAAAHPPSTHHHRASSPTELAQQTQAYRDADALRASDPSAALAMLRDLVRRWPATPIRPEVDLAIIDILVELDRTDDARRAARRFLHDHPDSERTAEIHAIADSAD